MSLNILNSNKKSSRKVKILPQFSISSENKPLLDLLEIQRKSFFDFLQHGIPHELAKIAVFRETAKNSTCKQELELKFNPETYKFISPNFTPKEAILNGKTYACKVYVQATLMIWSPDDIQKRNFFSVVAEGRKERVKHKSNYYPSFDDKNKRLNVSKLLHNTYTKWLQSPFVYHSSSLTLRPPTFGLTSNESEREKQNSGFYSLPSTTDFLGVKAGTPYSAVTLPLIPRRGKGLVQQALLYFAYPEGVSRHAQLGLLQIKEPTHKCKAKKKLRSNFSKSKASFVVSRRNHNAVYSSFAPMALLKFGQQAIQLPKLKRGVWGIRGVRSEGVKSWGFAELHIRFAKAHLRQCWLPLSKTLLPKKLQLLANSGARMPIPRRGKGEELLKNKESNILEKKVVAYDPSAAHALSGYGVEKVKLKSPKQTQFQLQSEAQLPFVTSIRTVSEAQLRMPLAKELRKKKDYSSSLVSPTGSHATQNIHIFRPWIFLGELPLMTKRGHFILNGSPRVIVNQIARCPGIYFQEKRRGVGIEQEIRVSADLIPQRGPWLRIQSDWEGRFWARLKQEGRVKYATLYEAFQEFEKEYNPPLICLLSNSSFTNTTSSLFSKSENVTFQERKIKEDRQKKALIRLFKNSSRYSLGKLGRSRVNERIHSSFTRSSFSATQGGGWQSKPNNEISIAQQRMSLGKGIHSYNSTRNDELRSNCVNELAELTNRRFVRSYCVNQVINNQVNGLITSNYANSSNYSNNSLTNRKNVLQILRSETDSAAQLGMPILTPYPDRACCTNRRFVIAEGYAKQRRGTYAKQKEKPFLEQHQNKLLPQQEELMAKDLDAIHTCLERLLEGQGFTDDIDNLKNRFIRTSGKLLQQQFELGLFRLNEVIMPLLGNLLPDYPRLTKSKYSTHKNIKGNNLVLQDVNLVDKQKPAYGVKSTKVLSMSNNYNKEVKSAFISLSPAIARVNPLGAKQRRACYTNPSAAHALRGIRGKVIAAVARVKSSATHVKGLAQLPQLRGQQLAKSQNWQTKKPENKRVKAQLRRPNDFVIPCTYGLNWQSKEGGSATQLRKPLGRGVISSLLRQLRKPDRYENLLLRQKLPRNSEGIVLVQSKNCVGAKQESEYSKEVSLIKNAPFRWLRTSKPINSAFREFFGSNPLSQYMDQTNPLAEITHKRRLSSMGPGGIKRETAGMEVRGIHPTHYGRVCPIETPEGKNAGLVNSPTVYGRVGNYGFLETPLYQVIENQVQTKRWTFFSAQHEEKQNSSLATCDTGLLQFNFLAHIPIPVQTANNPLTNFQQVERHRVGYRALSPIQTISIATALIPFLEHDDANRALMGSNMQRQAIPLLSPERPIVGTGFEPLVVMESGQALQATKLGCVSQADANSIIVQTRYSIEKPLTSVSHALLGTQNYNLPWSRSLIHRFGMKDGVGAKQRRACATNLRFVECYSWCKANRKSDSSLVQSKSSYKWQSSLSPSAVTLPLISRRACCTNRRFVIAEGLVQHAKGLAALGGVFHKCPTPPSGVNKAWGNKLRYLYLPHTPIGHARGTRSKKGLTPLGYSATCNSVNKKHISYSHNTFLLRPLKQDLQFYERSNQETCLNQRPLVQEGDWIQKGDFLADSSASHSGDLALGKNVTVAYMPWEGYNFEDAIVISDRLVSDDIYTSLHIERYEIKVSKNSQGKERITNRIPGNSHSLKHLDNFGIARISSWVQPGDILVGKVVELKRPLSPYERLAWELASRLSPKSPEREKWLNKVWLEDISLRLPPGVCGRVINSQIISTEYASMSDKEQTIYPQEVHIYLAVKRKIQIGDKLAGRHGNKGIVSAILPQEDMPYLGDGSCIDMVLNPLGVPSRMNLGQIFECLLGLAGSQLGCNFRITPFDEIAGGEASRSLVFLKLYQCRLMYKQQWLFTPTFPGKSKLFDGRTGEPFENWVTVGQAYMLKLIHMVDHKIHARSTGPYSLFTRQPVRGRSRRGGQRLGEMEVWAVEGFGAAYTLQEFLTIKSDDLKARTALQKGFYKQNDVTFGKIHIAPGNPEAFKVLVSELQALCLHIQM